MRRGNRREQAQTCHQPGTPVPPGSLAAGSSPTAPSGALGPIQLHFLEEERERGKGGGVRVGGAEESRKRETGGQPVDRQRRNTLEAIRPTFYFYSK